MQAAKVQFQPEPRKRDGWPPAVEIDPDAFERIDEVGPLGPWWLVFIVGAAGGFLGGVLVRTLG